MLKRKILSQLLDWKNKKAHKSLIITGQRQIGKTFIIDEVFSKEYEYYICLNFIKRPELIKIFDGNLDVDTMVETISLYFPGCKFEPGNTLLLFDELQECPNALASMKFWTEDGRFDVIGMGSALGLTFKNDISYPVGNVEHIRMYSLDFEEFLWAQGFDETFIDKLRNYFDNLSKLSDAILDKINEYLKKYMVIGGMPEVVASYVANNNLGEVHEIQLRLIDDYKNDIARYAKADMRLKAKKCFESIPFQLSKENHKFKYSIVESKATAKKFETSIDWLKNQLIVQEIKGLKRIDYPLEIFSDETNFRIYPTDIGMLIGMFDVSVKKAIIEDGDITDAPLSLILGTAKGGLYEALAADMLYKRGYHDLFFYKHEKNTSEIEFIFMRNGEITPVEIKAGKKQANSLRNILSENDKISFGYKMASRNIGSSDKIITLPIFMLMFM